jgi:hypothetical protein
MECNYGVFKKLPNGGMVWVALLGDLRKAEQRLNKLSRHSTAEYYVYDLRTGDVVARGQPAGKPHRAISGSSPTGFAKRTPEG